MIPVLCRAKGYGDGGCPNAVPDARREYATPICDACLERVARSVSAPFTLASADPDVAAVEKEATRKERERCSGILLAIINGMFGEIGGYTDEERAIAKALSAARKKIENDPATAPPDQAQLDQVRDTAERLRLRARAMVAGMHHPDYREPHTRLPLELEIMVADAMAMLPGLGSGERWAVEAVFRHSIVPSYVRAFDAGRAFGASEWVRMSLLPYLQDALGRMTPT